MALLELENVHTYYGIIHALKGVSLTVEEAEIVSLIGGNLIPKPISCLPDYEMLQLRRI